MSFPLVSIIVPTYNAENFIIESIESVLRQDYPSLEIIIADDCSTDNTQKIIEDYFKDKQVDKVKIFFHKNNLGITDNSNFCLKECNGKYIAFHAGDDVMLPGKISTQVAYMEEKEECTISYHNVEVFDSDTNKTLYFYNGFFRNKGRSGEAKDLIKYGCFACGCSIMVRREFLPPYGYDTRFKVATDWFLWIETLMKGKEIHYINKVLSRYRRHSNNTTSISLQGYLDTLNICNNIIIDYPQYTRIALKGYGVNLRGLRNHYNGKHYLTFLYYSFKFCPSLKTLLALTMYIISGGYIKK